MKDKLLILVPFLIFCLAIRFCIYETEKNIIEAVAQYDNNYNYIIILDAGHGGEDSGAVGFDGTLEKDINLQICRKIALFFDLFGITYEMTRTDDGALGDTELSTIRARKASDIHKRFEIINSYNNSVLLSIHQNFYPVEKYTGMQVFFAESEKSDMLAQRIQNRIVNDLQQDNKRAVKKTNNDIYLLYNAKRPSVMVECGFMSNPNELFNLKDNCYQQKLSYLITRGVIEFFCSQSV